MSNREEEKRLAAGLHRWLDGKANLEAEEDLASLRPLVAALREALPPDTADPAYRDSLRRRLLASAQPSLLQRLQSALGNLVGRSATGQEPAGATAWWPRTFVFGGAVATLLVAYALFAIYTRMMPALQPALVAAPTEVVNEMGSPVALSAQGAADRQQVEPSAAAAGVPTPTPPPTVEAATVANQPAQETLDSAAVEALTESAPAAPTEAPPEMKADAEPPASPLEVPAATAVPEATSQEKPAAVEPGQPAGPTPVEPPAVRGAATPVPELVKLPPIDATGEALARASAPAGAGVTATETRPADGLGMGGTTSGALSQQPTPHISVQYDEQAPWPTIEPSMPVYRLSATAVTLDEARDIAGRLGFDPAQVQMVGGDGAPVHYSIDGATASFRLSEDGTLEYDDRSGEEAQSADSLSDQELIDAARNWLLVRGLLPAEAGPVLEPPQEGLPYLVVVFGPPGAAVAPQSVRIEVGLTHDGEVVHLLRSWPNMEAVVYPTQSVAQLQQALRDGRGKVEFSPSLGDIRLPAATAEARATIDSIRLEYLLTYSLDGEQYVQPVIVLTGKASLLKLSAEGLASADRERLLSQSYDVRVTLPVVAEQYQTSFGVSYQLEASLPGAPATAWRYGYPSPTPFDAARVKQLGAKLGFDVEAAPPADQGDRNGLPQVYEWRNQEGYVLRVTDGLDQGNLEDWTYTKEPSPADAGRRQESKPLPQEQAVALARNWLKQHDLLAPDLGSPVVLFNSPDGAAVGFDLQMDGIPAQGLRGMVVHLTPSGEVGHVAAFWLPTERIEELPLLTPQQALAALQAGQGELTLDAQVLSRDQVHSERARIQSVDLIYRQVAPAPGRALPTFEPFYRFHGMMEVGESQRQVGFTVSLPAARP